MTWTLSDGKTVVGDYDDENVALREVRARANQGDNTKLVLRQGKKVIGKGRDLVALAWMPLRVDAAP